MFHDRFPEISLLLRTTKVDDSRIVVYDVSSFTPIETVDQYFVYGLGDGSLDSHFLKWLSGDENRTLIFIEDQLSRLKMCQDNGALDRIAANRQIHLKFLADPEQIDQFAAELAHNFPSHRPFFEAFGPYRECEKMRRAILREAFFVAGNIGERGSADHLTDQWMANLDNLSKGSIINHLKGRFKGVPAVICGAGPTLDRHAEILEELQDRALIFAGGSTLSAMSAFNVQPHFGLVLDPNRHEFDILRPSPCLETPIVSTMRTERRVPQLVNGQNAYLQMLSLGTLEAWLFEKLKCENELFCMGDIRGGMTVTTAAIALARHLGCGPIILVGVDLAFTEGKTYASGVWHNVGGGMGEIPLPGVNFAGDKCATLLKWVVEARWIERFAANFPDHSMIQTSPDALLIEGVGCESLDELATEVLTNSFDLRGWVYDELNAHKVNFSGAEVESAITQVVESAKRCEKHLSDLPLEHAQMQMQGELAYDTLLSELETKESIVAQCQAVIRGAQ